MKYIKYEKNSIWRIPNFNWVNFGYSRTIKSGSFLYLWKYYLLKEGGWLSWSTQELGDIVLISNSLNVLLQTRSPSKVSMMFFGTQDKCATCGKTTYPPDKVRLWINSLVCTFPVYFFVMYLI